MKKRLMILNKPYREPKRRKCKKHERYEYDYIKKNEFLRCIGGWVLGEYNGLEDENVLTVKPPKMPLL